VPTEMNTQGRESEERTADLVESAVLHGIFWGQGANRREFFQLVGKTPALAIITDAFSLNQVKTWAVEATGKPVLVERSHKKQPGGSGPS